MVRVGVVKVQDRLGCGCMWAGDRWTSGLRLPNFAAKFELGMYRGGCQEMARALIFGGGPYLHLSSVLT